MHLHPLPEDACHPLSAGDSSTGGIQPPPRLRRLATGTAASSFRCSIASLLLLYRSPLSLSTLALATEVFVARRHRCSYRSERALRRVATGSR